MNLVKQINVQKMQFLLLFGRHQKNPNLLSVNKMNYFHLLVIIYQKKKIDKIQT